VGKIPQALTELVIVGLDGALIEVRAVPTALPYRSKNLRRRLGMKGFMLLAAAMTLGLSDGVQAQEGDITAGKAYAEQVCAACHAVLPDEEVSPILDATAFQEVANTPGMTELALSVWLQSSHPTMPNIVLEQDDMRNVIAYIRSLKDGG
jgi:mono/diheme cytochrome c family protein